MTFQSINSSSRPSGVTRKIKIAVIAVIAVVVIYCAYNYSLMHTPAASMGESQVVQIKRGSSFNMIAGNLVKAGLLKNRKGFSLAAKLSGAHKKIKAGEYELSPTMSPSEILAVLVTGKTKHYPITVPEGYNIHDIAGLLVEKGFVADTDGFIKKAVDKELAKSLGLAGPTLEGYLFPDTYLLSRETSVDEIIRKMVSRYKAVFDKKFAGLQRTSGMNERQIITLASIIEKETGASVEMPLISAVFHNRIKRGVPLQSDPTVIYGILATQGFFDGNIKRRHLKEKTPYNTYKIYGLPPGPIANPGSAAIAAALNPDDSNYMYFVSRNDGTHKFSVTLREHNRAVYEFQKSPESRRARRRKTENS